MFLCYHEFRNNYFPGKKMKLQLKNLKLAKTIKRNILEKLHFHTRVGERKGQVGFQWNFKDFRTTQRNTGAFKSLKDYLKTKRIHSCKHFLSPTNRWRTYKFQNYLPDIFAIANFFLFLFYTVEKMLTDKAQLTKIFLEMMFSSQTNSIVLIISGDS